MRCVAIDVDGFVVDVVPQPADLTTCTLVLASPAEVTASPFLLSLEDGGLIGLAILSLWAVAFGMRSLIQTVRQD